MAIRLRFNKNLRVNGNKIRRNVINSIRNLRRLIYGHKTVPVPEFSNKIADHVNTDNCSTGEDFNEVENL